MARIRTVKPELFTDSKLSTRSVNARWLFVGLFTEADDEGRLIDSPKRIAGAIFPHEDTITAAKVRRWIDELEAIGCVSRYTAAGHDLLWLPHFLNHQRVSHPTPSKFPPHPEDRAKSSGERPEDGATGSGPEVEVGSGKGSSSSSEADDPGEEEDRPSDLTGAAFAVLVDRRLTRRDGPPIQDLAKWRQATLTGVVRQFGDQAAHLVATEPGHTPNSLADALEPATRPGTPADATQAAQRSLADKDRSCADCHGTGWRDGTEPAERCDHTARPTLEVVRG